MPIVEYLVPNDVSAEIEDGNIKQILIHKEKQVQDPPGSTIAVHKWVDRFELIMHDRESDQGIDFFGPVDVVLPVGQFRPNHVLSHRRRVNQLFGRVIDQGRYRDFANIEINTLDDSAHLNGHSGRNRPMVQHLETAVEGGAVA